jgi:GDP-4-dehydro-6-deoxy-D-mannose reductase
MTAPSRILITGASGFVGQHFTSLLEQRYPTTKLFFDFFDVTQRLAVQNTMRAVRPDACIHLAAISSVPIARGNPDRTWAVNLHGTLALAEAILEHKPDCHLLFVSTADAYGYSFQSGERLDESTPLAPANLYAATKAAADLALGAMVSRGLRVTRVRPFNHSGPGQSEEFVLPAFARQIARIKLRLQEPVLRVGSLDAVRDFLDVRDVCSAYLGVLEHHDRLPPGSILNIASGVSRRIGDILSDMLEQAGVQAEVQIDHDHLRPAEIPYACGNAARARDVLGWEPRVPWSRTLGDLIDYWMAKAGQGTFAPQS